jgi:hypothetical protein
MFIFRYLFTIWLKSVSAFRDGLQLHAEYSRVFPLPLVSQGPVCSRLLACFSGKIFSSFRLLA